MITESDLAGIFESFLNKRIMVIGDVMVDSYLFGNVNRISPEAPIPVVTVNKKENRPGGAANVVLNILSMGAEPLLCSVIGNDNMGKEFLNLMEKNGLRTNGIIRTGNRMTTCKTRIIGHHQQLLRVDEEVTEYIREETESELTGTIFSILDKDQVDAIIFEDYDKGVITPTLIDKVVKMAAVKGIPIAVDPKKRNFSNYRNVTLFKPNFKEISEGLKLEISPADSKEMKNAVNILQQKSNNRMFLVTMSEHGVYYQDGEISGIIPAMIRDIADVSGAGDTVISIAVLCMVAGLGIKDIAEISNLAGGLVCEKVGVVPVDKDQLLEECRKIYQ
ncbi:MAG: bifunctional ADP-heptose synthase [Bacteroidia bacterium]|nr:bifunctional ADP-heptose synthase [Bacteroidia bacterium]